MHNTNMNSAQEHQSDLEVILEFLEEHYRQESGGKSLWPNIVETSEEKLTNGGHFNSILEQDTSQLQLSVAKQVKANSSSLYTEIGTNNQESDLEPVPEGPLAQSPTPEKTVKPLASITPAEKGKKLRLFHFLFEVLEDPKMAHCVSWVPASAGVFCFSARHKEQVAKLWGQRKGNRMPMTYQKMSRAIRNYARSGEIFKVKKKLTYQFSPATLRTLKTQHGLKNEPYGSK